jgi:hypothetical protein
MEIWYGCMRVNLFLTASSPLMSVAQYRYIFVPGLVSDLALVLDQLLNGCAECETQKINCFRRPISRVLQPKRALS